MSEQIVCVACGEELGDPNDEFGEGGHFDLVEGRPDDDPRVRCGTTGQIRHPESVGVPKSEYEGGTDSSNQSASQNESQQKQPSIEQPDRGRKQKERGLDLKDESEPLDLLHDVLTNPIYELSEPQVREVQSWAEEFEDGMIPPDSLEDILGLMDGVSKQKSQLMRQKYELKLQRWMRRRSEGGSGPPLGMMGRRGGGSTSSINIPNGMQGSGNPPSRPNQGRPRQPQQREVQDQEPERVIDRRKEKARNRVDEFLDAFAQNAGDDVGTFYTDIKGVVKTALISKAERDPDWVIEKLETLGGFELIEELMEPSQAKQETNNNQSERRQPSVDMEVDRAASNINTNEQQSTPSRRESQQQPREQRQQQTTQQPASSQNQPEPQPEQQQEEYSQIEDINQEPEQTPTSMERLIEEQEEEQTEREIDDGEDEMFNETLGQLREQ